MLEPVPVTDIRQMSACLPFPAAAENPTPAHLPIDIFLVMRGHGPKNQTDLGLHPGPVTPQFCNSGLLTCCTSLCPSFYIYPVGMIPPTHKQSFWRLNRVSKEVRERLAIVSNSHSSPLPRSNPYVFLFLDLIQIFNLCYLGL